MSKNTANGAVKLFILMMIGWSTQKICPTIFLGLPMTPEGFTTTAGVFEEVVDEARREIAAKHQHG